MQKEEESSLTSLPTKIQNEIYKYLKLSDIDFSSKVTSETHEPSDHNVNIAGLAIDVVDATISNM